MQLSRPSRRRLTACVATLVTAGSLLIAVPSGAGATPTKPPPNPTDNQLTGARGAQDALSSQVGALGAQIAQTEAQLRQLEGQAELAEQKVALRNSQLRESEQKAARAKATVARATKSVSDAHARFVQYLQASYMDGTPDGTTGTLLTASDPSALLDDSMLQQYQSQAKLDAIGSYQRASVTKSNAEAAARKAVQQRATAARAARDAKRQADDAVAAQQQQRASLESSLATSRNQLTAAQSQLATLTHQRAQYNAYVAEQKRLAAIARARAERIRKARIAAQQAAAEAAARARANHRHHRSNGGGGSSNGGGGGGSSSGGGGGSSSGGGGGSSSGGGGGSSSGGGGGSSGGSSNGGGGGSSNGGGGGGGSSTPVVASGPPAPSSGGGWSAAKGKRAVSRAMSTVGTPYAWAGGGRYGPSKGVCDGSNGAPNDCYVTGYDCSGLVLYAWGKGWDHFAASQFSQAGSYHPGASHLKPGDLIFWSFNGRVSGIHHVAVYKGHGRIIEAPYSGGYVQVESLYEYGSFFGATRPLS